MRISRRRIVSHLYAEGSIVVVLIVWHFVARQLPSFILPSPYEVLEAYIRLVTNPDALQHSLASGGRLILSITLALLIGGALAQLARTVPSLKLIVTQRILPFLNSFPSMGWAILAVLWFGVSSTGVIFVETVILVPFCLINLSAGLDELDRELLEMGRSFTRNKLRLVTRVILPLMMPYIIATLRMTYGIGWKIALVAELFGASEGLGFLMVRSQYNGQSDLVLATCLLIVTVFILGEKLVIDPLARRFST
jgi:NitT/TauT family transport system permease protein